MGVHVAGDYTIGGFSIGETLARRWASRTCVAKGVGVSRARYFPGATRTHVKLLAEPGTLRLIGAQVHGGEGVKERCDFLAFAAKRGATLEDLAWMENIYSPPIGALYEPIAIAAQNGLAEHDSAAAEARARCRHEPHSQIRSSACASAPSTCCGWPRWRTWRGATRADDGASARAASGAFWRFVFVPALPARAVGVQAEGDAQAEDDRQGWPEHVAPVRRAVAPAVRHAEPTSGGCATPDTRRCTTVNPDSATYHGGNA